MSYLGDTEDRVFEGIVDIIAIIALVAIVLLYMGAKKLSIPPTWYPSMVANKFAGGVDSFFANTPLYGGKTQSTVDDWLARMVDWFNRNTPNPVGSKGWADYEKRFSGAASIATGTGMENEATPPDDDAIASYDPQNGGN